LLFFFVVFGSSAVAARSPGSAAQSAAPPAPAPARLDTPLLIRSNNLDIHIILDEL
jgi:hypothetical protein